MAFQLPDLPYDYAALEPYIDAETMQVSGRRENGVAEMKRRAGSVPFIWRAFFPVGAEGRRARPHPGFCPHGERVAD